MAPKFGIITGNTGSTNMIIQSVSCRSSADIAEVRDESGKVIHFHPYSKNKTFDIRGLLNADTFSTEAGQTLSIGDKQYIIESTSQYETNTGWVEVSLTAKTADEATII